MLLAIVCIFSSKVALKVKVLFILSWIDTSANKVGFHVGPAYFSQLRPGTHIGTAGWSGAM